MAKAFSVLFWNVEHLGAATPNMPPKKPIGPIIKVIADQNADVGHLRSRGFKSLAEE